MVVGESSWSLFGTMGSTFALSVWDLPSLSRMSFIAPFPGRNSPPILNVIGCGAVGDSHTLSVITLPLPINWSRSEMLVSVPPSRLLVPSVMTSSSNSQMRLRNSRFVLFWAVFDSGSSITDPSFSYFTRLNEAISSFTERMPSRSDRCTHMSSRSSHTWSLLTTTSPKSLT